MLIIWTPGASFPSFAIIASTGSASNMLVDDVTRVIRSEAGDIAYLETKKSGNLDGDLFIDCSGFRSLLLGETMGVPFVDCSDVLFIDRALAVQVPYDAEDSDIVRIRVSTAQKNGWIWDIGLQSRRGVGYVFSSNHTTADAASAICKRYIGEKHRDLQPREIKNPGRAPSDILEGQLCGGRSRRRLPWSLRGIRTGADRAIRGNDRRDAAATCETMDIIANVSTRRRNIGGIGSSISSSSTIPQQARGLAFWIDNRDPRSIPDSLKEQIELWRYRAPGGSGFYRAMPKCFPPRVTNMSLFGMGFRMDTSDREMQGNAGRRRASFCAQ